MVRYNSLFFALVKTVFCYTQRKLLEDSCSRSMPVMPCYNQFLQVNHVVIFHFFCETFFASSNISRAPTRLEYHADVQCTLISSSVEIKNRGVYHLNISHCLFFDRMYVLHSCIYQRIVVLKTTGGPQGSGVLRALMAML